MPDFSEEAFIPAPEHPLRFTGLPRQQTNPSRRTVENWDAFLATVQAQGLVMREDKASCGLFSGDAGGLAYAMPQAVLTAQSAQQVAVLLRAAQQFEVPVTTRGGGLTTEGESVAYGGVLLDMTGMSRVLGIDTKNLNVRTQAGIFWTNLAEELRREGMDYLSAPLNLTSSVGGTLGVGGVDVNSMRFGCSADQALSLQVVTPTGDIVECSDEENPDLFQRVILGYGQFGVITEATLRIRPYTPLRMRYYYYASLRTAIEDLQILDKAQVADYSGILTMMDKAVNLLVGFDSEQREAAFTGKWQDSLRGYGEKRFALHMGLYYVLHPWRWREALFLWKRKRTLLPDLEHPAFVNDGWMHDRTVVFSRAVWKHWGGRQMVIPDISTKPEKFVQAVEQGNRVCRQYFPYYTLYCVGIKLRPEHKAHYELSCIPPDAEDFAYGCEFEPMLEGVIYSRDYLQTFKNAIYDVGLAVGGSYYRFGGMMKAYIRRLFGDELVDRHLAMKRQADPKQILNRDVIF